LCPLLPTVKENGTHAKRAAAGALLRPLPGVLPLFSRADSLTFPRHLPRLFRPPRAELERNVQGIVHLTNRGTRPRAGLTLTGTDANGLPTSTIYDPSSLRLSLVHLPTSALIKYTYDDNNGLITQSVIDAEGLPASVTTTHFNGIGRAQLIENVVDHPSGVNRVSQQYDRMGRLWQLSQPYQYYPLYWTVFSYDSLGRVTTIRNPDGTENEAFYDEAKWPSSASIAPGQRDPGQTIRRVDEVGRESWSRTDALGQLVEVVTPAADRKGSVFERGDVDTRYFFNVLGLLTRVVQGRDQQERDFQYDPLGRLTAEYLPEKSRTLDDNGIYVGEQGQWSDVFTYDDRSNLISHVDARGVKVLYEFLNDPLNRLQSVSYQTPATGPLRIATSPAISSYFPEGGSQEQLHGSRRGRHVGRQIGP
jgi:hypothetical protein